MPSVICQEAVLRQSCWQWRVVVNTDEDFLACPPLTSCCAAWLLTGFGPVLDCGLGLGTPALRYLYINIHNIFQLEISQLPNKKRLKKQIMIVVTLHNRTQYSNKNVWSSATGNIDESSQENIVYNKQKHKSIHKMSPFI